MSECLDRLRTHFDNVTLLMHQDLVNDLETAESKRMVSRLQHEAVRMCRVMKVLQEYVSECDGDFSHERSILPLHRFVLAYNSESWRTELKVFTENSLLTTF